MKYIVYRLNKYNEISGSLVSRVPYKPKQYRLFEKLKSNANESELYGLTNHYNPTIRMYAYWGLIEMNSLNVLKVILKNQLDTVLITFFYGCTGKEYRVIEFMTRSVNSYAERNNIILSSEITDIIEREEKEWYKREIKPMEDLNKEE